MFEIIGDFDANREKLQGRQREAVIGVIAAIQKKNRLTPDTLRFHRELGSPKTCPGSGISYKEILDEVTSAHNGSGAVPTGKRDGAKRGARRTRAVASTASSTPAVFAIDESRIVAALSAISATPRAADVRETGMEVVEEEEALEVAVAHGEGMVERAPGARGTSDVLDATVLSRLRPHVVNLVQGEFRPTGVYQTTAADVDAIFGEHLEARLAQATEQRPLHLMLWAHGGLVPEKSGLLGADHALEWWKANGIYPIHFVWETGLLETVEQLVRDVGSRAPEIAARDLWDYTTDPLIERLARPLGARLWAGMKRSAERASTAGGGARHVAEHVARLAKKAGRKLRVHAAGHSAGSIFHTHLVPTLLELGVTLESLHFLAPAVRIDTFLSRLRAHVTDRKRIRQFAMFTMTRDWEKRDNCGRVYHKSLLYLVSLAFEPESRTPILGLEEFARTNAACQQLFGLNGQAATGGEAIWARSVAQVGRHATRAAAHADFDEDPATMNALVRRVLGVDDVAPIVEYEKTAGGRDRMSEEEELPADLALFLRPPMKRPPAGTSNGSAAIEYEVEEVEVTTAPPPPRPSPNGGRRLALCIGINDYAERPLAGCVADATLWASTLRTLGFPRPQTLFNEQATRQRILDEFGGLVQSARAGDVLVLQYAGHGTYLPDVNGDEDDDGRDEALCPIDYEDGQFVIDDDLRLIFAELPAGVNLTCFFDCCHSGTITRLVVPRTGRATGVRGDVARARFLPIKGSIQARYEALREKSRVARAGRALAVRATADLKEVVFSACRADQVAYESGGQGDFTRITTELLERGAGRESHAAFLGRIRRGFGSQARQEPQLDCATGMRDGLLLTPVGAEV
jgi:hypothetical protein